MLYLDNAATTKPNPSVLKTIVESFQDYYNPSSLYSSARYIKEKIEKAREYVAQSINAEPNEIYFTSSGSEANTWAIRGFFDKQIQTEKTVYCFYSKTEHILHGYQEREKSMVKIIFLFQMKNLII